MSQYLLKVMSNTKFISTR